MPSALLRELRPLFAFQIAFQSEHGRRATDGEHPAALEPLLQVYRKNKIELLRLKGEFAKMKEDILVSITHACIPYWLSMLVLITAYWELISCLYITSSCLISCHQGSNNQLI